MGAEAIAALIVGFLGMVVRVFFERRDAEKATTETKIQVLREDIAQSDNPAISGALDDQHLRVQQALRDGGLGEDVDNFRR